MYLYKYLLESLCIYTHSYFKVHASMHTPTLKFLYLYIITHTYFTVHASIHSPTPIQLTYSDIEYCSTSSDRKVRRCSQAITLHSVSSLNLN